jgi:D-amino-acid dehydrogenase
VSTPSVAVVGGGIVGLACAYELHRAGAPVTVLERDRVGSGASGGNTGWVVPSMTSPLPAPGMVREGMRQLVTRGSSFVLRPTPDLSFLRWLWHFHRSCSPARFDAGVRALLALNRRTLELFDRYREEMAFEMHATGLLIAARSVDALHHFRSVFERLRELGYEGAEPDELDSRGAAELEPALDPANVVAALHARIDRYVRPEQLVAALAERLRADNVAVLEHTEVTGQERRGQTWELQTTTGARTFDRVVVASGVQTGVLLQSVARRVPMQPARGYSVTLGGSGTPPRHALYLMEARLGVSPYEGGVRIAGVFELGARQPIAPPDAGRKLVAAARPYLRGWEPDTGGELQAWAGLRPATADGLPLIGEVPGSPGMFVASGHGMLGITLAPATAALLAPLVLEGRKAPELEPFDPGRRLR